MSKKYLSSFSPLCSTRAGKKAIERYNIPPYIDGSCRREPDFENELPCITGLCRPGFAEKLNEGDEIIYVTNKKGVGSRKIIAKLRVLKIFNTHDEAANYYRENDKQIPNNLMVSETEPFEIFKTHRKTNCEDCFISNTSLEKWNKIYIDRANKNKKVAQCEVIYLNLYNPKKIIENILVNRKLTTRNPPILSTIENQIITEMFMKND